MKLSMYIIEHWLQKYDPIATIVSDELTIAGIRLFSYEKTPDPDYLYLGRTSDFFEKSQSREVLLVHRKDVISLRTQELEDVFDYVMDAFVLYQKWEQDMLSAFGHENPEQEIINACKNIFGPMFFTNTSLQIAAFSRQYPKGSINRNWDDFWDIGTLSVASLIRLQNGRYMERLSQKWNCEVFYEKFGGDYPHSLMISQENAEHQLTGQLTIISKTPFPKYQIHLAYILKKALCMVAGRGAGEEEPTVAQSLLRDFIQENPVEEASLNTFYQMIGQNRSHAYVVVILQKDAGISGGMGYFMKALGIYHPQLVFCTDPDSPSEKLVCCLPVESLKHYREDVLPAEFLQTIDRLKFTYSVSYPYIGLKHLHEQYRQASAAMQKGKKSYYYCALDDLTDLEAENAVRKLAVHPALEEIRAYDRKKGTGYYEILKTYLRCERNRILTAQQLFVHKNTLVYRLQKIVSLFALELDETYEREYLMFSFRSMTEN